MDAPQVTYLPTPDGWVNPLRPDEMEAQERKDYREAVDVFGGLLHGRKWSLEPQPMLSTYDGYLSVSGKNFLVEWKDREQSRHYGTYPLLQSKYNRLMDAEKRTGADGVLYLVLNGGLYTLYRLDRVNLDECIVRPWNIKKYELSDDEHREPQLTIFLPFTLASCEGNYNVVAN